ncbi:MAG: GNAT family N-acetyltransferase [Pseudomonadota bacterium]
MRAPHLFFESERLAYRPLEVGDVDLAIEQWTDAQVVKYVDWDVSSEEKIREEMPTVTRRGGEDGWIGIWALIVKATGEKIGTGVLTPLPIEADDTEWDLVVMGETPKDREIEVGYILKRSAWGKGYATEACERLLQFGFEHSPLDYIVATIDPENSASRRVLLKSGLTETGTIRAYGEDIPGFRTTREEWREAHERS